MFMGYVDIIDQKNQSTSAKRKEWHLSTYIFVFVISLICLNSYVIYDQLLLENLIDGEKLTHAEFKRKIAEQLCTETEVMESTNTQSIIPNLYLL